MFVKKNIYSEEKGFVKMTEYIQYLNIKTIVGNK